MIIIELFFVGGFPLNETSELGFLSIKGEIMKLGNNFVRIGFPKFLLTLFQPN